MSSPELDQSARRSAILPLGSIAEVGHDVSSSLKARLATGGLVATTALAAAGIFPGCVSGNEAKNPNYPITPSGEATQVQPRLSRESVEQVFDLAQTRYTQTVDGLPRGRFPSVSDQNGNWIINRTTTGRLWRGGFAAGTLLELVKQADNPNERTQLQLRAEKLIDQLEPQSRATNTHDVGFKINTSFGLGYDVLKKPSFKRVVKQGAASLASRFNPKVGTIKSWGPRRKTSRHDTIIDNMVNLELLYRGAKYAGSNDRRKWLGIARQHATTTMDNHVRSKGNVFHRVVYNPNNGKVKFKDNPQGKNNRSSWSRGQAWAMDGFTSAYQNLRDKKYLRTALRAEKFFRLNASQAGIPKADFVDKNDPSAPEDTSAAAIAASAAFKLYHADPNRSRKLFHFRLGEKILTTLTSPKYIRANGQAVLSHVTHSARSRNPAETNISTADGDFYYIKALGQYKKIAYGSSTSSNK